MRTGVASLTLILLSAACKEEPAPTGNAGTRPPPPAASSAKAAAATPAGVKIVWRESEANPPKIEIAGLKAKGEVSCVGPDCTLRVGDLPEGAKVKIGDKEAAASLGSVSVELGVGDVLASMGPADVLDAQKKVDPKKTLTITFADGAKVEAPLPPMVLKFTLDAHAEAQARAGKPLLFGAEKADAPAPAKPSTWARIGVFGLIGTGVVGPAKSMVEIDRIAVDESLPKRDAKKRCGGYKAAGDASPRELPLFLVDKNVKLVDRKTGKVIEEKKFEAAPTCPSSALGDEATSYPEDDVVIAWIKSKG